MSYFHGGYNANNFCLKFANDREWVAAMAEGFPRGFYSHRDKNLLAT